MALRAGAIFTAWLIAGAATACGDDGGPSGPRTALAPGTYRGTVTTTIAYFDAFGNSLGQQTTQGAVDVVVSAPRGQIPGAQPEERENNPFHLDIAPVTGQTAALGQIEIHSAVSHIVTGTSGRRTTLQYWNLQVNGTNVSGTLVDPHNAEAAVANFVNALDAVAPGVTITNFFPMARGTTLSGTITPAEARLRISGGVIQGTRQFVADIVAARVP